MQPLEGVAAVEHPTPIHLAQIPLDITAGECGTAEEHGNVGEPGGVELLQVFAHDERALHQEAAHSEGVGVDLLHLGDHLADGNLDTDVVHFVAVVGADDVDQVLADVVYVALHRGEHEFALARGARHLVHVRLEVAHGHLHGFGTLQNERQLHLSRTEQFAHFAHAVEQHVIDDFECLQSGSECLVELGREPFAVAIDDALTEPLLHRPAAAVGLLLLGGFDTLERRQQKLQRVVVVGGLVEDDVATQRDVLGLDAGERKDLAGVNDCGIEPCLHAFVEEHTVQHLARSRVDSETHVGKSHHREGSGNLLLDASDALDALDAIATKIGVSGGEWEGEWVEDEVAGGQSVSLRCDLVQSMGDLHLPLHVACLPTLVDEQADHRCAVVASKREDAVHSTAGFFAVLQVGAVQDASPTRQLQCGFHHLWLGGVDHQWHAGLAGKATGDFGHVGGAIASDVIHAHVQHVGAFTNLFVGHLRAGVPVAGQHGIAKGTRAVGVGALADVQHAVVLFEGDRRVEGSDARFLHRLAAGRRDVSHRFHHLTQVLGCGAATTAHHSDAQVLHVVTMELSELCRGEVVMRSSIHHARQACVRQHTDGNRGVLREMTQMLLHFCRTSGTVDPDYIGLHRQ